MVLWELWVNTTNPAHMCIPHPSVYHMFFLIMKAGKNEYHTLLFKVSELNATSTDN